MQRLQTKDFGYWLLTKGSNIYLSDGKLPFGTADELALDDKCGMVIGEYQDAPLWLVEEFDDSRNYFSLRDQLILPERIFNLLNRGVALNYFWKTHRFCGVCGAKTQVMTPQEWAVECTQCQHRTYPMIAPSIIVAVRKGDSILLANHVRHREEKIYTTLAGFVEVGETLEQTVEREVFEESGLKIKNLRYIGSQPWSFPNSLMLGFLADYAEGEIAIQPEELNDAGWFRYDAGLPHLPPPGTIARKLIELSQQICADEAQQP
ncbi:NAD(+) diphosphatase [Testudinibacter aquarius]|uniref:NAD-capped RNA hydrolase NudC n=1 Tax=Testudinibacter aquarius TaxID=1524974 RepID=A0A4R3YA35_9PAST|nr:NAD(+) diphosphatase [Testudinibacter aquarius]KAE9525858.1 NADH pyrophosphatase [Testudinibacter aquarius]TCV88770.1 NAD+ diphosphatase [Testudinibacter aquarius]TNG93474.1 NAD(+) diphosphatase [Testudinibacter aquarius]